MITSIQRITESHDTDCLEVVLSVITSILILLGNRENPGLEVVLSVITSILVFNSYDSI